MNTAVAEPTTLAPAPCDIRARIADMEVAMSTMPQVECPVKHYFADGIYVREIFMPAGSIVVGKIHKQSRFNHIVKGKVRVVSQDGTQDMEGPCSWVSPAGAKRALVVLEDTIWFGPHCNPKNVTDIEELETMFIAKDYDEVEAVQFASTAIGLP